MAVKFISVKCPECGASLPIEEGREKMFCSYCGTPVIMTNENEHIIRHVDEAGVKRAETDRIVKLKQLEMDSQESDLRKKLIFVWLGASIILTILGIVGMMINSEGLSICLLLAMSVAIWGALGLFANKKGHKSQTVNADEAVISEAMAIHRGKNYHFIVDSFRGAGFTQINVVPLNDLNFLSKGNNGKVEDVTINGDSDFDEGDVFSKSSIITITYHSIK